MKDAENCTKQIVLKVIVVVALVHVGKEMHTVNVEAAMILQVSKSIQCDKNVT